MRVNKQFLYITIPLFITITVIWFLFAVPHFKDNSNRFYRVRGHLFISENEKVIHSSDCPKCWVKPAPIKQK